MVSSIAPIKTIQKPSVSTSPISSLTSTVSLKQSDHAGSSVLLNAINNSPNLHESQPTSNKASTTTTIQLVNQSQTQAQRTQIINQKTSIIQRIQSFPPSQSTSSNTVATATSTNVSHLSQPDRTVSYKILNQQNQNSSAKNNDSNQTELDNKCSINSDNLNLLSNTISQYDSSGQSKSPEIDGLKVRKFFFYYFNFFKF